jgi:hypothetical protein
VHTEIAYRHGARFAAELGLDAPVEFDMEAVKAGLGVPDVERLTYRDVMERREIMRKKMTGRQ